MSIRYNDKKFAYLLILSLLVHACVITFILRHREKKESPPREAYMVELRDLTLPRGQGAEPRSVRSPQAGKEAERSVQPPPKSPQPTLPMPVPSPLPSTAKRAEKGEGTEPRKRSAGAQPSPGESLVRRRQAPVPDLAKLFPTGKNLSSIEDAYRKKYSENLGGGRVFLGQNNDTIGSYERRLIAAVNSNWRIVGRRTLSRGDTGYGLLLITITRDGSVEKVEIVESSGNRRVDESVVEAVRTVGYVGPLPKRWPYDKLEGYYTYVAEEGPY